MREYGIIYTSLKQCTCSVQHLCCFFILVKCSSHKMLELMKERTGHRVFMYTSFKFIFERFLTKISPHCSTNILCPVCFFIIYSVITVISYGIQCQTGTKKQLVRIYDAKQDKSWFWCMFIIIFFLLVIDINCIHLNQSPY